MSDQRFLVTARKYRPQLFQELVAQEHVTGTLKNALRLDRLAHAYLFSGPRGVGKTTAARILAKAINCTTPPEDRIDKAEPCRQCASCESFEQGRNLNIIEIDAASNNKVEDIRDLRETVRIPPQGARKKVYIVDEVHMLTTQAFNALLKTLEEPPAHALFIFATTEPHKVLPTIQSRCQRFDFRRISVQEIFGRLEDICASEGVTADEGALMLISRKGDGALRDALSVFDQAVSLCGADLRLDTLVDALGVVDEELYFEVTDNVASSNVAGMIGLVDRIVTSGYDLQEFLDGLAEHLRNVLVALAMPDTSLIEAAEATRARYTAVAKTLTRNQVLRLLAGIDGAMDGLRTARQPRLRLELALIRMASLPATTDIKEALRRIEQLAKEGGREVHGSTSRGGAMAASPSASTSVSASVAAPQASSDSPPSAPATPKPALTPAAAKAPAALSEPSPAPSQAAPVAKASAPVPAKPAPVPVEAPPAGPPKQTAAPAKPAPDPSTVAPAKPAPDPSTVAPVKSAPATPAPAPAPAKAAPSTAAPDPTMPAPPPEDPGQGTLFNAGRSRSVFGTPALRRPEPVDSSPSVQPAGGVDVLERPTTQVRGEAIEAEVWETVVSAVMSSKIHLGALLHHAQAVIREGSTLALIVPDDFHARVLREAQPDLLSGLADVGLDQVSRIEFEVNGEIRSEAEPDQDNVDPQEAIRRLCEEYPALQLLMERFGGEIVW